MGSCVEHRCGARSLAPLVKTRGFGTTPASGVEFKLSQYVTAIVLAPARACLRDLVFALVPAWGSESVSPIPAGRY